MVAAAMAGKRFLVLDRPNPISGRRALGPVTRPGYESFVGRKPIALVHGMTIGELAGLYNGEWIPAEAGRAVELAVVELGGWSREMFYDETGLPWVAPSPNLPTLAAAVVYPGTCLFEGTELSEGRGTTRPFEQVGAPYVDWRWCDTLTALELPGVAFREQYFVPTFSTWAGQSVGGVELQVTDRPAYDPVRTAVALLVTAKAQYPGEFAWRGDQWIDKLTGSDQLRNQIDAGQSVDLVVAGWQVDLLAFRRLRERYLLYP